MRLNAAVRVESQGLEPFLRLSGRLLSGAPKILSGPLAVCIQAFKVELMVAMWLPVAFLLAFHCLLGPPWIDQVMLGPTCIWHVFKTLVQERGTMNVALPETPAAFGRAKAKLEAKAVAPSEGEEGREKEEIRRDLIWRRESVKVVGGFW